MLGRSMHSTRESRSCSDAVRSCRFTLPATRCSSGCRRRRLPGPGPRLRQGSLHEIRISHPDARRRPALHVGLRPQGHKPALPDHAQPDALQRSALRRRRLQVGPRPFALFRHRRLHRGLPGRARALDVGGRVRQHAAAPAAKDQPHRHRREHRHVRHDRLADQARAQPQRPGRDVGHLVSRASTRPPA